MSRFYSASGRISLSMMDVNNDSKLFICSDCLSINFSSLEKLSVFCELGHYFGNGPYVYSDYFDFPVLLGHRRLK